MLGVHLTCPELSVHSYVFCAHVNGGNFCRFSEPTDSPLHSYNGKQRACFWAVLKDRESSKTGGHLVPIESKCCVSLHTMLHLYVNSRTSNIYWQSGLWYLSSQIACKYNWINSSTPKQSKKNIRCCILMFCIQGFPSPVEWNKRAYAVQQGYFLQNKMSLLSLKKPVQAEKLGPFSPYENAFSLTTKLILQKKPTQCEI